ncbi:tetrahydromethanopterin S-methyltransferase subunit MtrC [Methanosarcina sp. UBA5]|uniref:tetrahydromethanopterin S-methyltransferase subunit MtrC n=1 Tax=Methanosarcina sp. UBA5 TaxID=1915593 RepID=UPI0025FE356B|nr:tetrahydromethanopterin S-methyltransferase subunit C [Methanosarcina sp. UBA5]
MTEQKMIPPNTLMAVGAVGGLVCIYLAYFLSQANPIFVFFGALGAVFASIWGADAVRRIASYGLGTGVPSIGLLALGMGIIAVLFGLALDIGPAGPIVAFIVSCAIGAIIGIISKKVVGMTIPIMVSATTEIAGAGALLILGLSIVIAGSLDYGIVVKEVIRTGFIMMIYIAGGMAMLHPHNSNLGPDETQDRLLALSAEKAGIAVVLSGFASVAGMGAIAITVLIGIIIWYVYFGKYYALVKRDAYKVVDTGLLPTEEEMQ